MLSASVEGANEGFPVERGKLGGGAGRAPSSGTASVDRPAGPTMAFSREVAGAGVVGAARSAMYEAFKQVTCTIASLENAR